MKGCLGVGLLLAVILLGLIVLGAFKLFQGYTAAIDEFPEYARREVVYAQYGELIDDVNAVIEASESMYDLAAGLEKLAVPNELVYLTLTKENDDGFNNDKLEIIKQFEVSSSGHTMINGTGHGELNDIPIVVIELPVNRHAIKDCLIYLRRDNRQHSAD